MALRYVVLRVDDDTSSMRLPRMRSISRVKSIQIEIDELAPRQALRIAQLRGVRAVAPAMPMKLIAPTRRAPVADDYGTSDNVTLGVRAVGADTCPYTGKGVVVAVLDTGIDPTHAAFKDTTVEIVRKNFAESGDDDANDEHGHGTHCAGTVFGGTVANKRIAVSPGVTRALIGKVLGKQGGESDRIAQAIQWAVDNGANVISMSLGIDFPGFVRRLVEEDDYPVELATSIALEGYRANVQLFERHASFIAAQSDFGRAVVLVAAAGNESRRDLDPRFEIAASPTLDSSMTWFESIP